MIFDNPVFKKELLCGLRSPRSFLVQLTYISLICTLILPVWPTAEMMAKEFQERGHALFQFFTIGQFVVIALLAPAIAATAFAGEKERRVYDLIYTSPLQLPRIVIGKLMAAISFLLVLVLSSLPAMSVCFQLGGVSGPEVINAYIFLVVAAVSCGMVGLLVSAFSDRSAAALMVSYLIILPLVVIISAVAHSSEFFFDGKAVPVLVFLLAWLSGLGFFAILSALKKPYNPVGIGLEEERVEHQEFLQFDRESFPESLLAPKRKDDLIEDGANPIYEKELRSEIFGRGTLFIRIIILLGLLVSIGFIIFIFNDQPHYFVYYLTAFAILVAPAFSCGAFTLERERRTMEMLLATLIPPWRFVLGKFTAVYRFTVILTGLLTVPLFEWVILGDSAGQISNLDILAALASYFAILLATIALSCAIAMAISMTASSTVEAMLKSYVTLAFLFVGTFIVYMVVRRFGAEGAAVAALTPQGLFYVYAGVLGGIVLWVLYKALLARDPGRIRANLVALVPVALAGAGLVAIMVSATAASEVAGSWENSLGVLSPFLAAVQVTDALSPDQSTFMDGHLPSAFYYVGGAALFAGAILAYIVLRWEQVMYVESN